MTTESITAEAQGNGLLAIRVPDSARPPVVEAGLLPEPGIRDAGGVAALAVHLERCGRLISVRGELDMATVPVLAQVMTMLLDLGPGDSTIDLAGVTFIDAAGLGCLVDHSTRVTALGATVSIIGATPRVRRVFDIVGLGDLLEASWPRSGRRSAGPQ